MSFSGPTARCHELSVHAGSQHRVYRNSTGVCSNLFRPFIIARQAFMTHELYVHMHLTRRYFADDKLSLCTDLKAATSAIPLAMQKKVLMKRLKLYC